MSSYRSTYVPWNKNSLTSNYSSSAKSDSPSTTTKSKYESGTLSRPSSRAENKLEPEKPTSKLGTSYRSSSTSAYSAGNPRDRSASREPSKYGSLTSASAKDTDKASSVRDKYATADKSSSVRDKYATADKPSSVRDKYATVEKPSSVRDKYATQEKPTSVREKYSSQSAEKPSSVREKYATPDKPSSVREKYTSSTGTYPGRTDIATRIKTAIDKKDTPPVSFRPLSRTGTRSRDPSPAEREKTDNYRLYPRSYTRSTSREPEPVTSPTLKYGTKTAAASKEDLSSLTSRYGTGRTSRAESREDLTSRLRSTSRRNSREDLSSSLPRYSASRHSSKEDLTIPSSTKYINSRFLPRNTVEKSYTAYTKPVASRSTSSIEDKRRSRDNLMAVLQTHASLKSPSPVHKKVEDKPIAKSPSTPISSTTTTTTTPVKKEPPKPVAQTKDESEESETEEEEEEETETETEEEVVMETVTVITRGTSPTPPSQSTFIRNRRADMARILQKDITRPKKRKNTMVDKEMQSDRMDDTARYSRFGSSSTVAATPWSSYLDLKYNSPRTSYSPVSRYSNSSYSYKTKDSTPSSRSDKANESRSREPSVNLDTDRSERSVSENSMSEKNIPDRSKSEKSGTDRSRSDNSISHKSSLESSSCDSNKTSIETPSSMSHKTSIESSSASNKINDKPPSDPASSKAPLESVSKLKKKTSSDRSSSESINSISRNSSSKNISQKSKSDAKSKDIPKSKSSSSPSLSLENSKSKSNLSSHNSKQNSSDASSKKQLPPPVPKGESPSRSVHTTSTQNKDFRKSVLNMNTDGKLIKKSPKRSSSVSSDSEPSSAATCAEVTPLETSVSAPKLSTSQSLSKLNSNNSSSKLPQKLSIKSDKDKDKDKVVDKTRRSPSVSSESSSTTSSSEDDAQKSKTGSNKKKLQSATSSRTSMVLSSADELSLDRPAKPPPSPRTKTEGPKTEAEAKSFLMRALAPVTNFFKVRQQDSSDKVNWMLDSGSENSSESAKKSSHSDKVEKSDTTPAVKKSCIKHVESGERAWWLEENAEPPEGVQKIKVPTPQDSEKEEGKVKFKFQKHDSGDEPWWMNDSSEIPEGVEKLVKNGSQVVEVNDGRNIYKIRRNESGKVEWWLDSSEGDSSKSLSEKGKKSEFLQPHRIRHIDSGERAWWLNSNENIAEGATKEAEEPVTKEDKSKMHKIRHQDSGEKAWWLMSHPNIPDGIQKLDSDSSDDDLEDLDKQDEPLGDRASPEGLEMPRETERGRLSPYDNVPTGDTQKPKRPTHIPLFISRHTNIDDILGGGHQMLSPLMDRIYSFQDKKPEDECEEIDAGQVRIHDSTAQRSVIQPGRIDVIEGFPNPTSGCGGKLDDAALQLYKDGDYGSYLDLEASISEQQEEFDGFQTNKKNSIVLRTQLSVRVHTIIEKLLTSEGRELRRALFSLKQIFQEDKDLVHEFVQNDGLACLIKVGSEADQNYQNYILRALGQVMLYVDGMNGVMEHNQTVQWLYTLIASKFRLVVKTALKLLLVFVEYTDSNCMLLIKAVNAVDGSQGLMPWSNIMRLLKDFNAADTELLIYAMTLVNKCLNGIPDQDTYYDQTDALEEQGIEGIIQRYMSKQGTDLDLLQQFQIYEAVLQHEDGEDKGMPLRHLDESIRKTLRNRKSMVESTERRKSRRHSTGNTPLNNNGNNRMKFYSLQTNTVDDEDESSSSQSSGPNDHNLNGSYKENNKVNDVGVTPALRRRRERAERQRSFIKEQQESAAILRASLGIAEDAENGNYTNNLQQRITNGNLQLSRNSSRKDLTPLMNAVNKLDSTEEGILKKPWVLQMMYGKPTDDNDENNDDNADNTNENDRKMLILKRENTVKDLTQKLASQNILHSPSDEGKINRIGDMSGLISKAKEGLAKSKSKADVLKSPTSENVPKVIEVKKSENELRWEELVHAMSRPLNLCDMDFTDLQSEDEADILAPIATSNGIPPPPPPLCRDSAPPPPPIQQRNPPPFPTSPPMFGLNMQKTQRLCQEAPKSNTIKKNKKTVKLFWKEVRDDPITLSKLQKYGGMIWDELNPVTIDTQKLEHLFESRAKDLISKKQQEMNKNKEIIVLDHKRSNAINIGMTKLPPPRSIKTAILKMDATIMNREGIEKLLTMLPTEEERTKIQDAQAANPDLPLGSAEQFLLTLASISELPARLKLWAFKLDFENSEREIAEPLMDLKQGIELLKCNKTFRGILSTLLSIGIFLNGNEVKGFQIEYLAKVPEVKDTVHKHSLLHHLCHIVMEKFPEATDLYSEIGAITRASKIDFDELALNIHRLETDCKASWDHLKLIGKHDGSTMMKVKMSDFLADCAERIILLGIVHRRVMTRYHKFLLWLGIPLHRVADTKPNEFCRIVSEFALEYRTTRERVLQQLEKKANHRERNKTRGKMITEVGKFKSNEDRADAELRQLLGSDISDVESMQGTLPWRRQRKDMNSSVIGVPNGNLTDDGDDEILESLVKTATKAPSSRTTPRERKRTRHADRKSLRRTLKNGLSEEEKKHIAAYIKGY